MNEQGKKDILHDLVTIKLNRSSITHIIPNENAIFSGKCINTFYKYNEKESNISLGWISSGRNPFRICSVHIPFTCPGIMPFHMGKMIRHLNVKRFGL